MRLSVDFSSNFVGQKEETQYNQSDNKKTLITKITTEIWREEEFHKQAKAERVQHH